MLLKMTFLTTFISIIKLYDQIWQIYFFKLLWLNWKYKFSILKKVPIIGFKQILDMFIYVTWANVSVNPGCIFFFHVRVIFWLFLPVYVIVWEISEDNFQSGWDSKVWWKAKHSFLMWKNLMERLWCMLSPV